MIDKAHELPVSRQVKLLDVSRSSLYYQRQPIAEADLELMRKIDQLHLEHPFAGARMLRDMLRLEGLEIGRKHVGTLMKKMSLEALYRKANTSRRHQGHRIYPYLLRHLAIDRPNQVWAMDTSAPCKRGWRNPNRAGWLPTGSWNVALLGRDTGQKGAAKFCRVLTAGCHKQRSLILAASSDSYRESLLGMGKIWCDCPALDA